MAKLEKIGVQLYTVRKFMETAEDIKVTFDKLKKLGYDQAQTAGMTIPYADFADLAKEAGIEIVGTHDSVTWYCESTDEAMDSLDILGTKNMGTGGFFPKDFAEFDEYIPKINALAKKIAKRGFKFTYHNHGHEFRKYNGVRIMDRLFDEFDKDNVSFCLDTSWVQFGGGDVRHWIDKLKGRIDILHLKDMAKGEHNSTNPQFYTEIGNGNLYWEGIIESALNSGVKYFVVEQDTTPGDPFDSLKMSADYLRANFF